MAVRIAKKPTKQGNRYYFDTYYEGKRFRSKSFPTKAEAKKAEREWIEEQEKGIRAEVYTFNEVIDKYIEFKRKNWKKSTEETTVDILNHIKYKLGKITVSGLTREQYEGFLKYLDKLTRVSKKDGRIVKKPYSVRYKNRVIMYLKSVCVFANTHLNTSTKIPWLYENWKQTEQKQMQVISEEQFQKFVGYISDERFRCFFTFLFYTGCRRGEALALTFDDIQGNTANITKSLSKVENKPVTTKTKSSIRRIPLSKKALEAVETMRERYKSGYVFAGKKPLAFSTIERVKTRALKEAGLPIIRVHDFRHSFITMMVDKGMDIAMLSRYVGHASIKQTLDTYTHYYEDKMKDMIDSL